MPRAESTEPPVRLTFDDGPCPEWTPRVLQRLAAHELTATFFVLGARVRAAPDLLDLIRAGGHEIGLHGDRHLDHRRTPPDMVRDDTTAALATMTRAGVQPTRWRLPWGRQGAATLPLADEFGLEVIDWDHDTHDWRGDGWEDQPAIFRSGAAGVVLMHDALGPGATRAGCANTLELIDRIALHRD